MDLRGNALKRIACLYALLERQDALNLRKSSSAVVSVEKAIECQISLAEKARSSGEQALLQGDQQERLLTTIQGTIAQQRRAVLEMVLATRKEEEKLAREKHATSQIKRDQTEVVLKAAAGEARTLADRKLQAMADDRYLSSRQKSIARRPSDLVR